MYTPPPAPQPHLPNVSWAKRSVASLSDLQSVASTAAAQQLQVAADNAPIRIIYGRCRIGAQIADAVPWGSRLVVIAVWGEGEINAIESATVGDTALPAGVTATHYTGTAGQTVNATLVAAYASCGITFTDAFPGIAYSVFVVNPDAVSGFPVFNAIIQGKKVYDPRTGTTAYSPTPALCLADLIVSELYGLDRAVIWSSVSTVADKNEALVGGEQRRLIGLCIDSVQKTRQWVEALRTYAGCFVRPTDGGLELVADEASASVASFDDSSIAEGSLRMRRRGVRQLPTVMEISYTDTSRLPWADRTAVVYAPGVRERLVPVRPSRVSLVGIHRYSQAYREGIERLNKVGLSDLVVEFTAFDEAVKVQRYDIITITHKKGLSNKPFRVLDIVPVEPGRWHIVAEEHDPLAYSDAVEAEPSFSDTNLPNPAEPPKPTGVTAVEEVYQMQNGTWASRLKLTWDATEFAYLRDYRVEIYANDDLIETATPREAIYRTGPVKEGTQYTCKVAVISAIGATSAWEQDLVTALGKSLVPSDVPSVSAFEAGGTVYGQCAEAVDIDILRYKWKYWPVGGGWATGTLIDKVDSLRCTTSQIPVGTWVLGVKAVDSIQQESVNATTCQITVTSDTAAFFVSKYDSTNPTLTNMAEYSLGRDPTKRYFVTEDNVAWDTKFSSAMDTYTNPLSSYHNSVTSTWEGEGEDFGQLLGGQWAGGATVAAISGTIASYMGFSTVDSGYTFYSGLSHKQNARWAKLKHEATGTATLSVTIPEQSIRLDAIPHEETHSGTSSAANPVTVHLDNEYVATKNITITPQSSTPVIATADNIGLDAPNPADKHANITISNTYTVTLNTGDAWVYVRGRHSLPTTGKWYWELVVDASGLFNHNMVGVCSRTNALINTYLDTDALFYFSQVGNRFPGNIAYGDSWTTGDVIGVAYDADNDTVAFYKNNSLQSGGAIAVSGEKFLAVGGFKTDSSVTLRIDKSHFSYAPPTGFKALPYGYDVNIADTSNARVAKPFMTTHDGV